MNKEYYMDRPVEPCSDDEAPVAWAAIAHYAEENLEKAFEQIAELKDDLCRVTSDCDGYRTTMLSYEHKIKDLEEQLGSKQIQSRKETSDFVWKLKAANEQKTEQLTKAKELLQRVVKWATTETGKCEKFDLILVDTKQFLKEVDK